MAFVVWIARIKGEERDPLLPRTGGGSLFPGPFFFESTQFIGGQFGNCRLVNPAQVGRHGFAVLPGAEVQGMAHQMHDAGLNGGLREGGRDRFGKALKPIDDGDEDILNPAVLQLVHHREPEFGTPVFGDPRARHLAHAVTADAGSDLNGLVFDPATVGIPDLHTQGVEDNDGAHPLQRPAPPFADRQADSVEPDHLVIHAIGPGLILVDQPGFETALPGRGARKSELRQNESQNVQEKGVFT